MSRSEKWTNAAVIALVVIGCLYVVRQEVAANKQTVATQLGHAALPLASLK